VLDGVTPQVQFVKVVNDELVALMGSAGSKDLEPPVGGEGAGPQVVLLAGLQGVGKTTAAGKLAMFLTKRRKKVSGRVCCCWCSGWLEGGHCCCCWERQAPLAPLLPYPHITLQPPFNPLLPLPPPTTKVLLVATDVYRPAAIDQLVKLGSKIDVPVYEEGTEANPVEIAARGVEKARAEGYDAVIVDTAGRLQVGGGGWGGAGAHDLGAGCRAQLYRSLHPSISTPTHPHPPPPG